MPRELPRREIAHAAQAESAYTQQERAIEQAQGLKNTRRWIGVDKVPVTLAPDVVSHYAAHVRSTVADL